MKFPDAFLDELRARVPVSEIVGRRYKLRKQGAEFVAIEDKSITVNDKKHLWWDFGKGIGNGKDQGGDIFSFLVDVEGLTFPEAVKTCASIAGLDIPKTSRNGAGQGISEAALDDDGPPPHGNYRTDMDDGHASKIAKTYDYTDETGGLIYQVVRFEPKEFRQRRPDGKGGWIWSIKDIQPLFYRLRALLEALGEERMVFITEGEKDADTFWDWGVPATTNS